MSLTSFIKRPEVIARIKPLQPELPRKIDVPLQVEPKTKRYMLVGTAFDYLIRFELQRRASHAISERWIAEYAPDRIFQKSDSGTVSLMVSEPWIGPEEVHEHACSVLEQAKAVVAKHIENDTPVESDLVELARNAIRLAKLDPIARGVLRIDPGFFEDEDPEDVQDLLEMLAIVPFDELVHDEILLLNPDFKDSSAVVGGADADLISGDRLIDFKVTKEGAIKGDYLDQILGYLLLARDRRSADEAFPLINRIGIYFCRHGYLWIVDAATWTDQPQFEEIEKWFFEHAGAVFSATPNG